MTEGILGPAHRWLTLGVVSVIVLVAFEAMSVATAMPVAVADLGGLRFYAWSFSGFLVTSLFAMVVAGERCDAEGPRRPLLAGVAVFAVGLLVAGSAPSMAVFVLGRAVQGLGGGAIIVAVYVVVGRAYEERLRPRLFSALSGAWVLPSIVGPSLSGWVAQHLSWRLVFLAMPVLVVPAVAAMYPRLAALGGGSAARREGRKRAAAAAAVGVATLQYAGQRHDWFSLPLATAALALLAPTVRLLLPAGTLRFARGLPTSVAMRGVLAGSFFGAETFVPLMLVTERGFSPARAGLLLTGGALGWALGSWFQGRPTAPPERWRLVRTGCALVAVAVLGVAAVLLPGVPTWPAALAWIVGGIGMGLAMASVGVLLLELSPRQDQGANSAALQVSDALASVVTIGAGGAVYAYAVARPGPDDAAFAVIYVAMAVLAVAGAVLASRLRPVPQPAR